jgi:hypothetical protein
VDKGGNGGILPRHRWVMEILRRGGTHVEPMGEGVFACALGEELARFLGRPSVTFTFLRKAAMQGRADLAAPGSWLHDQLLRFARERGRVASAYLEPRAGFEPSRFAAERLGTPAEQLTRLERRYGSLLVFTFRIFYYSEPAAETLLSLGYDAERRRIVRRALPRLLSEAKAAVTENGYRPAPALDVGTAFSAVWGAVEDEVEMRVRTLEEAGRGAYEARIRVVESYYRQLLAEEKRLLESRASKKGQDESRGRIDLLKVEWERRMKEEADRLRPQVVARLSAIAVLRVPLERWGTAPGLPGVWIDTARAEAWPDSGENGSSRCDNTPGGA